MATEEELSIEAAAAERRERLQALRMAHQLSITPDDDQLNDTNINNNNTNHMEDAEENQNVSVKFRNYLPHDKQLQDGRLPPPVLPKFEDPVATAAPEETKEDPFLNIAPKKPNWDLRRDIQKKLDKLERRTQKALFQLMKEEEENRRKLAEGNEAQD